jgi:S1-C subfamily serine protease
MPRGIEMDKKLISLATFLAFFLLFWNDPAAPQVYRYKDKNGVVHFTDAPPDDKFTRVQDERFLSTQFPYYRNNLLIEMAGNRLELVSRAVVGVKTNKMRGSGFLINPRGHAITNYHVIAEAGGNIQVVTFDGREWNAWVISTDPDKDLALIDIGGGGYPYLPLGKLTDVSIGKEVFIVGNPLGLSHSLSKGIVSSVRKGMKRNTPVTLIQTDAAINAGNSGGPLITPEGLVLGVVTFKAGTPNLPVQGIGFAVSSEDIISGLSLTPAKENPGPNSLKE